MCNWLKNLFCGGKCHCHCEGKEGEMKDCCNNKPSENASNEVKTTPTPEQKQ